MIFGSYHMMVKNFTVFDDVKVSKYLLITEMTSQANLMSMRLNKRFKSLPEQSVGYVTATGNVSEGDIVNIGDVAYTFTSTPNVQNSVKIGASATESLLNLHSAINESPSGEYNSGTDINITVESIRDSLTLTLMARTCGRSGNDITLTTTSSDLALVPFSGGKNEVIALSTLNIWLTALSLLTGAAMSNSSGISQEPLINRLKEQIDAAWEVLDKAKSLITVENNVLTAASMTPITDDITRAIDMCDPVGWAIDPRHAVKR